MTWPLAIPGLVAFALAWGMAFLLYFARPERWQNRLLALVLAVEGTAMGMHGLQELTLDPRVREGVVAVQRQGAVMLVWLYLAFVGTLDSPLSRPFRGPVVRTIVVGFGLAPPLLWMFVFHGPMPWSRYLFFGYMFVLLYALVVAVTLYARTNPGTPGRRRSLFFLLAFGFRDIIYSTVILFEFTAPGMLPLPNHFFWSTATILFVVLAGYGILKEQLFDIDLKIRWTIKQSTIAAAFIGVFFVVSEGAQQIFQARLGPTVGILAAGALVFAIAPLQRFADRVAQAAMPGVKDSDEYRTVRKREVYRAAVASARQDGTVTERERDVLATLAEELGLKPTEARALERDG